MEFVDKNLTSNDIKETLNAAKQALEIYREEYKNKTIKIRSSKLNIDLEIRPEHLPHLLGINTKISGTYLEYIGRTKIKDDNWLEELTNSYDFIKYMIYEKNEDPFLTFSKIKYKSENFCGLTLSNKPCFIFKKSILNGINITHIGVFEEEKIVSLRLIKRCGCHYDPKSLYVYNKELDENNNLYNFIIPSSLHIIRKRTATDKLITNDEKEEIKEKILEFNKY